MAQDINDYFFRGWALHELMRLCCLLNNHTNADVAAWIERQTNKATSPEHMLRVSKGAQSERVYEGIKQYIRKTLLENETKINNLNSNML